MAYVSMTSNARSDAAMSIDPLVANAQGMMSQLRKAQESGGPYSRGTPQSGYGRLGCTCTSCPVHAGVSYGGKSSGGTRSYGPQSTSSYGAQPSTSYGSNSYN